MSHGAAWETAAADADGDAGAGDGDVRALERAQAGGLVLVGGDRHVDRPVAVAQDEVDVARVDFVAEGLADGSADADEEVVAQAVPDLRDGGVPGCGRIDVPDPGDFVERRGNRVVVEPYASAD